MQFRALLLPKSGEKDEQVFCVSLEEAKKWGRRTLWDRHRKTVQNAGSELAVTEPAYSGPQVVITEIKAVLVHTVYPWDVTDEDKKEDLGTGTDS